MFHFGHRRLGNMCWSQFYKWDMRVPSTPVCARLEELAWEATCSAVLLVCGGFTQDIHLARKQQMTTPGSFTGSYFLSCAATELVISLFLWFLLRFTHGKTDTDQRAFGDYFERVGKMKSLIFLIENSSGILKYRPQGQHMQEKYCLSVSRTQWKGTPICRCPQGKTQAIRAWKHQKSKWRVLQLICNYEI